MNYIYSGHLLVVLTFKFILLTSRYLNRLLIYINVIIYYIFNN